MQPILSPVREGRRHTYKLPPGKMPAALRRTTRNSHEVLALQVHRAGGPAGYWGDWQKMVFSDKQPTEWAVTTPPGPHRSLA